MAQYQISVNSDKVKDLMIRDDGMKKLGQEVLKEVLEAQAAEAIGAERYERSEGRQGVSKRISRAKTDCRNRNPEPEDPSDPRKGCVQRSEQGCLRCPHRIGGSNPDIPKRGIGTRGNDNRVGAPQ